MKVGDVVRVRLCGESASCLGIVELVGRVGPWIRIPDGACAPGALDSVLLLCLTPNQRAIVNAAIAAEALRRMG
jgi:hypothetical protein